MTAPYTFATLAETTSTADPGAAGTSLAATSRTSFPQSGQFHIVVQDADVSNPTQPKYPPTNREVMLVTGGFGSGAGSFTVTRAQEGTAGVAHASGSYIALVLTAGILQRLQDIPTKFNVVDYGAIIYATKAAASAGTDATSAIQAAINAAAAATGGGAVYLPAGFYRIATGLDIANDKVHLVGAYGRESATLVFDDVVNGGGYGIHVHGAGIVSSSTLTANANSGQRTVTVTSTAGFAVHDWVYVEDTWTISSVSTFQESFLVRVAQVVDATHLLLEESLPATYHSANGGVVRKMSETQDVSIINVGFVNATSPARPANRANMVRFTDVVGGTIRNCRIDGTWNTGIWLARCRDAVIADNLLDHIIDQTGNAGSSVLGIEVDQTNNFRITGNTVRRTGQGIVLSFGSHTGVISHNVVTGAGLWLNAVAALPTDSGGRGIKCFGGSRLIVANNVVHNFPFHMIRLSDCHTSVVDSNMLFDSIDATGGSAGVVFDGNTGGNEGGRNYDMIASNNNMRDLDGIGIWFVGGSSTYGASNKAIGNTMRNVLRSATSGGLGAGLGAIYIDESNDQIIGNTILGYGTNNEGIRIQSGGAHLIIGNRIRNGGSGYAIQTLAGLNRVGLNDTVGETLSLTTGASADLILPLTAAASSNPTSM